MSGPVQDGLVIVDGKKMRHGGVEMVNAANGQGQYLGGVITQTRSNEIPAARQLLKTLDLVNKVVLSDALHTQVETGRQILFEQGGDYLLTVKGNRPTLQRTLQHLFEQQVFSPSLERQRAVGCSSGSTIGGKRTRLACGRPARHTVRPKSPPFAPSIRSNEPVGATPTGAAEPAALPTA